MTTEAYVTMKRTCRNVLGSTFRAGHKYRVIARDTRNGVGIVYVTQQSPLDVVDYARQIEVLASEVEG